MNKLAAAILAAVLKSFAGAFLSWLRERRQSATERELGRADRDLEAERKAREIQQDVTDAGTTPPRDLIELARRARSGGL